METEEFLKRVLPQNGTTYYTATVPPGGKFKQNKHDSFNDLVHDVNLAKQQRADVYFATGSFKNKRQQQDVELKKCFYVDIDIGKEPNKYHTKKEAVQELFKFADRSFVKPNLVIDSGGGVHAYWVLDTAVNLAKWQPVANALKEACKDNGFIADESVTADSARVLRAPGSINFKHGHGKAVNIIYSADDYKFEDLKKALMVSGPAIGIVVDNDDLYGGVDSENRTWYAKYVVQNCPMFKDAAETGGAGLPEALWSQQLHVLAYCEDGEDYVHEISKGYSGYAWAETNLKWNQKKSAKLKNIGPTTCDKFSELSTKCADCPMRDKVRSPLHLGSENDYSLPKGYGQTELGIYFFYADEDELGNKVFKKEYFLDFNIKDYHLLADAAGEGLICSFQFISKKKDRNIRVNVSYPDVCDNRQLIAGMARHNIAISDKEVKLFKGLLMAWATTIQNSKGPEVVSTHLGWSDSPTQFALVDTVFRKDKKLRNKSVGHDRTLAFAYTPKGEVQPWIDAVDIVCQQKRYPAIAAILTAFASPLLHFLQDNSVVMSFVSSASGTGKTTSLQLAQAVWGDPRKAMNQMDDTENSVFNKLGYTNSLPAYWDEVRTREDVGRFVRLMFQLTLGREKARLTQTIEQRKTNTWEAMLILASNESFADHAKAVSETSEAGRVRIFEIEMPRLNTDAAQDKSLASAVHKVFSNYGVVGVQYAEYLARNHDLISKLVNATLVSYSASSVGANERLWLSTVTVLVVAAHLAKKLKFMDINVPEFIGWLEEELEKQRADIRESYKPPAEKASDAIAEFIAAHQDRILVSDFLPNRGTDKGIGKVYFEPRSYLPSVGAIGLEFPATLRVRQTDFNTFVRKTYRVWPKEILKEFSYKAKAEPISPIKGAIRTRVYDIDLNDSHLSGLD